jgi:drug/metabolite transporter (DMT)-like permease
MTADPAATAAAAPACVARPGPARLGAGPPGRRAALSGNGLAALSTIIWAAGFPAAEALLASWDPIALVAARFVPAVAVLLLLLVLIEGWPRGLDWRPGLVIGAVGFGGSALMVIWALAATDPVTVAVIASASPLCGALVERAFGGPRLTRGFALGLAASVAGGVIATWGAGMGGGNLLLGALFTILSCLFYAWLIHETVRRIPGRSALAQTAVTVTGAGLATVALALVLGVPGWTAMPAGGVGGGDIALLAVYGIGAIAVTQFLFVGAVRRIGVALASFHINLSPFYVMLILMAMGGGWSWMQALGAAVVIGGVLLAQR